METGFLFCRAPRIARN